jgi:hypothetical protein
MHDIIKQVESTDTVYTIYNNCHLCSCNAAHGLHTLQFTFDTSKTMNTVPLQITALQLFILEELDCMNCSFKTLINLATKKGRLKCLRIKTKIFGVLCISYYLNVALGTI